MYYELELIYPNPKNPWRLKCNLFQGCSDLNPGDKPQFGKLGKLNGGFGNRKIL